MGKTVSTELAYLHPGPTRNPDEPGPHAGRLVLGSAAAVAAGMEPLAIGTQTGGSVIRPAAYCGITGSSSFGAIPRTESSQSPSLDTTGVFARSVEDAALLAEPLFGHDPADSATFCPAAEAAVDRAGIATGDADAGLRPPPGGRTPIRKPMRRCAS
ncbi:MAG: amidase family protein [Geminicoccaceae bacterium]